MKLIVSILTLFVLDGCSTYTSKSVFGKYETKGGFEWGSSIWLKEDSTFIYNWQTGLVFGETNGIWAIDGSNLVLNSYSQPRTDSTPDYYILNSSWSNSDSIRIELFWSDTLEVLAGALGVMFYQGDSIDSQISNINGILTFKKNVADSIKIRFITLKDIVLTDFSKNLYKIVTIDDNDEMYEYFTNEYWKIRGDNFVDKSTNEYYYEKKFYKVE